MRKTKIICTLGPATSNYETLEEMHAAGMDIIRLNMSHAPHSWVDRMIGHIVELNKHTAFPVGILLDTQGPEIRTGVLENDLDLKAGDEITITVRDNVDVEESSIRINYDELIETVNVGDKITVDNGLINLQVLEKNNPLLRCKILDGGKLGSKKHVNLPGIRVNLPAITQKIVKTFFMASHELDYIALSFVRDADDVLELRKLIEDNFPEKLDTIKIIAKIEDQLGVKNLEEIVQVADGIMVARGDLGVEIDLAELPTVQRHIVKLCARHGKRVIVATHLLESMIENPIPTRAEVTDVANAVYEGADAIMLSGETTVGKHPVRCVKQLDAIARATEKQPGLNFTDRLIKSSDKEHLAATAVELADSLNAEGIVVVTRHGIMANYVTNCHPESSPIFAFTNIRVTRRLMTLNRYLYPFKIEFSNDPEETLRRAFHELKTKAGFEANDKVVVISDLLIDRDSVGIQIRYLP